MYMDAIRKENSEGKTNQLVLDKSSWASGDTQT